jgi:hypothetical protein
MEDAVTRGQAGGTGSIGRDGGGGGVRAGGAGLNGRATRGRASRWDAQGQVSGAGSIGRLDRWVQVIDLWLG